MRSSRRTVIAAKATLFSDLFYQGRFTVPWHQRCYDWKRIDVRALLYDIDEAIKEKRDCYFLGAIMLVNTDHNTNVWEINDGQQRMVTMSLMCASLCRRFAHEMKESQREGHALRILFDLDFNETCTLDKADSYIPRIKPPQNDKMRYRQIIKGNTIGTNGALTVAWKEIENFFDAMNEDKLNQYFDFLIQKLEVACLYIPISIDPNAVYETLNNRGKKLDDFDLIRNYLYSHFNSVNDSEKRVSIHDNLQRIRMLMSTAQKASEYMRCHLQCKFGFLRKDNFYRDVRRSIRNSFQKDDHSFISLANYAFDITDRVAAPEFLTLFKIMTATSSDIDFHRTFGVASGTVNSRRDLTILFRELRAYKVSQPLVFAILSCFIQERNFKKRRQIAKIAYKNLSRLSAFILRTAFVAPKFEPSHFETEFSNFAMEIMRHNDLLEEEFANFLRDCDRSSYGILDDSKFYDAMLEAKISGKRKIKLFLLGLNDRLQSNPLLLNDRLCNIEHILPISSFHSNGWSGFDSYDPADWINRLGNLTLLGPNDNKLGTNFNAAFTNKYATFHNSEIALTRELSKYETWNPDTIKLRQERMTKLAIKVWSFD